MYKIRISDLDELKPRLRTERAKLALLVAPDQWCMLHVQTIDPRMRMIRPSRVVWVLKGFTGSVEHVVPQVFHTTCQCPGNDVVSQPMFNPKINECSRRPEFNSMSGNEFFGSITLPGML